MPRRQPSRPGLSYLDANSNRLVTYGPDVLGIKAEIEARWPGVLEIYFDTWQQEWVIVEKGRDGIDRHVLSTKKLTQAVIDKLNRIDQAKHVQGDTNHRLEVQDAQAEKEREDRLSEAIGEPIERFEHALRGSGILPFNKLIVADGEYIKAGKKTVKST